MEIRVLPFGLPLQHMLQHSHAHSHTYMYLHTNTYSIWNLYIQHVESVYIHSHSIWKRTLHCTLLPFGLPLQHMLHHFHAHSGQEFLNLSWTWLCMPPANTTYESDSCLSAYLNIQSHFPKMHACIYTHLCMYTCMYVYMYVCIYVCICIYIYIYTHTHTLTHKHMHMNTHLHTHTHIYLYIYIYTHTHTHT